MTDLYRGRRCCLAEEFSAVVMADVEGLSVLRARGMSGVTFLAVHWALDHNCLLLKLLTLWSLVREDALVAQTLLSNDKTPSSDSLALATSSQPLLASGFLGDGCMMPSTCTLTPAAESARRARCSATLPTPITMVTPSASTAWHSAMSQRARRASRSSAGSSGGVKFFPLALMKMRGHRLCTKQCLKKWSGSPHNFLKKPQKRDPLTSFWVQASPVIRRLGCSSWGWPTSPVIFSQSTTDLTSPKGTWAEKQKSLQLVYHVTD